MLPEFYICPKKYHAREQSIIGIYREYFSYNIPKNNQYWTMCGPHAKNGVFQSGSELGQLTKSGIISEDQFYGVDIQKEIIDQNNAAKPKANWIHGDFQEVISNYIENKNFSPAIVNADFISMKEYGVQETSEIMELLEENDSRNVMLISNIMFNNPHQHGVFDKEDEKEISKAIDSVVSEFENRKFFRSVWSTGNWDTHPECFVYNGTGKKSRTVMGTFIFFRKI